MESREEIVDESPASRPTIARRSCDHCRARKVRSIILFRSVVGGKNGEIDEQARSDVTEDRLAQIASPPGFTVPIARSLPRQSIQNRECSYYLDSFSEQKIDDIVRGVDGIKQLLQGLDLTPGAKQQENGHSYSVLSPTEDKIVYPSVAEPEWDYSGHIVDFIKAVVNDRDTELSGVEQNSVVSSLKNLLHAIEGNKPGPHLSIPRINAAKHQADSLMPPLDAAVAVLRWAKAHDEHTRMVWISRVLPLDMFSDICRKVYFAIDDYNEIDFILANGYLSYVFSEHISVSGLHNYREYCRLCRENLHNACARLPLLLPPSMEVIAALTLGAFNAVEDFRISLAWSFISNASNLCQTLGYHLARPTREVDRLSRAAEARLFWTIYRMEKGLSLRLGRSSNIRDIDVTLPFDREEERHSRLGRIQGKVWDQLYSPTSLAQVDGHVRGQLAEGLAKELRELIGKIHSEISNTTQQLSEDGQDTLRDVYLQAELVCQYSLLALILRAIPPALGSLGSASDDCIAVAREVLDLHQRCVTSMRENKNDPFMLSKYLSWSVMHHPFVPFSILFSRAVQLLDVDDLARLERFAASWEPEQTSTKPTTNFQRLYELLCQAARLYIDANTPFLTANQALSYDARNSPDDINFTNFDMGARTVVNEALEPGVPQMYDLGDWYFGNQQLMSLLDENITF
ncbi:hypothetical protein B7463_g4585, partial [Scytalidium lignicola]